MLGVITAIRAEAGCVVSRKLPFNQMVRLSDDAAIWVCGMGDSAARAAAKGLHESGATALVSFGVAGALDESLRSGDLVLPESIYVNGEAIPVTKDWRDQLKQLLSSDLTVVDGILAASKEVVSTETAKRELAKETGACAVDMESGAIAEVAANAGIPFIAVRAITDPLKFSPPAALLSAVYPDGSVNGLRLMNLILRGSVGISTLMRLGKGMRKACGTLSAVASGSDKVLLGHIARALELSMR